MRIRHNKTVPFLVILLLHSLVPRIRGWVLVRPTCSFFSRVVLRSSPVDDLGDSSDDNAFEITNPLDLQRSLRSVDNTFKQKELYEGQKNKPLDASIVSKIKEIARKQVPSPESMNVDYDSDEDGSDEDNFSVFLDGDAYMQASNNVKPDGSLPAFVFGEGEAPQNKDDQEDDDASIADLMRLVKQKQDHPTDVDEAKAMRDRIFKDEEAFTAQSTQFLEGLGGNVTASEEAKSIWRKTRYEKEQSYEVEKLGAAVDSWQEIVQNNQTAKNKQRRQQKQPIAPIPQAPSEQQAEEPIQEGSSEWVAVDDPSTGEQFYWNAATGEMKFDLDGESI